ncbi:MAG: hypothetical protein ACK41E_10150 [Deinococcales bacterium]
MTKWVAGLALGSLAMAAQSDLVLTGKMLGYKGQPAEILAALDASGDPNAALQIGFLEADGRFKLTLPATVPDEFLSSPEVREHCGDVTLGLKLAALTDVYIRQNQNIIGSAVFANRRAGIEQLLSGKLTGVSKVGFWFYANRAGRIVEYCDAPTSAHSANVSFKQGWNEVTGVYLAAQKPKTQILNGHARGLLRWFFVAQR